MRIQLVDGLAELVLDGVLPLGREDLSPDQLADVKAVDGGAAFGANLRLRQ